MNYAPELTDGSTYLPIDFISNTQIGATNLRWDVLRIYSLDFIKTMPFIVGEISLIEKQEEQTFIGPDGITYTSILNPVIKVNGKDANGAEKILTLKYLYGTTKIFSNQRTESIQFSQLNVGMKIKAFYDNDFEWALLIEEIK